MSFDPASILDNLLPSLSHPECLLSPLFHPRTVLGPSTTQLLRNLSYALPLSGSDELVVSKLDHEANIAPWVGLAARLGLTLKWWTPLPGASPTNPKLDVASLEPLLSPRTRLVTCTHVSNLLGGIHDVRAIADAVHKVPGAMLCVDGVAFAPHRRIDVQALDVDMYTFSWYKVYGPHIAQLYVRRDLHARLHSLGHYFHVLNKLETRLGLAGASYELAAPLPAVVEYFGPDPPKVWQAMAAHEAQAVSVLLEYLTSEEKVTVFGEPTADLTKRVPTVCFVVRGMKPAAVVEGVERESNFGFRSGHMYAKRLCEEILGVGEDGVVRISLVHYNTGKLHSAAAIKIDDLQSGSGGNARSGQRASEGHWRKVMYSLSERKGIMGSDPAIHLQN